MSESLLLPALRRLFADLERRVGILERRASGVSATAADSEIIFSYAGTLASGTESPPVLIRHNAVLSVLAVAMGTSGSTSTTIQVKRDGTVVATVVVPSGDNEYNGDVTVGFTPEQKLSLNVLTAGTGAANMTAAARLT